jgi:hypothetical protein
MFVWTLRLLLLRYPHWESLKNPVTLKELVEGLERIGGCWCEHQRGSSISCWR